MRNEVVSFDRVEDRILLIRDQKVILDSDVAALYGVETKRVNEAVKNNPDKFPEGYLMELSQTEKEKVVENFDHLRKLKYSAQLPTAFTEKGLYMIAAILKSPRATETFHDHRNLLQASRTDPYGQPKADTTDEPQQKSLMQKVVNYTVKRTSEIKE